MPDQLLPITGTFLDEITWDIPSQNWGPNDWRADLDTMQSIGIDTLVIIRSGLRRRTVFPSKTLATNATEDLALFFLDEAAVRGMRLFIGNYDSGDWAERDAWREEIELNRVFMREIGERYAGHPAFGGWYLSHETSHERFHFREIYQALSEEAKTLTPDKPVLISPYFPSRKIYGSEMLSPDEFADNWLKMLKGITTINIAAFQDGTAPLEELDAYLARARDVMHALKIELWNNVETFSREMPMKFPPLDFRELHAKLRVSKSFASKNITFEFSHFMSPHSCYLAARNLFRRYTECILSFENPEEK